MKKTQDKHIEPLDWISKGKERKAGEGKKGDILKISKNHAHGQQLLDLKQSPNHI